MRERLSDVRILKELPSTYLELYISSLVVEETWGIIDPFLVIIIILNANPQIYTSRREVISRRTPRAHIQFYLAHDKYSSAHLYPLNP